VPLVVELVFAGTVIAPPPLQLATDGSESAGAPLGTETALTLQVSAFVVANEAFTVPPLLEASVVDWGVNDVIVGLGATAGPTYALSEASRAPAKMLPGAPTM